MSPPPDGSSFRLEIRATVVRVGPGGSYTNDRLEISDSLTLDVADFLGISKVLGRFHDLADELRHHRPAGRPGACEQRPDPTPGMTQADAHVCSQPNGHKGRHRCDCSQEWA